MCLWAAACRRGLSGREPAGLARPATSFHLLAQMKGGKAKCLNASPSDRIAWLEREFG